MRAGMWACGERVVVVACGRCRYGRGMEVRGSLEWA